MALPSLVTVSFFLIIGFLTSDLRVLIGADNSSILSKFFWIRLRRLVIALSERVF